MSCNKHVINSNIENRSLGHSGPLLLDPVEGLGTLLRVFGPLFSPKSCQTKHTKFSVKLDPIGQNRSNRSKYVKISQIGLIGQNKSKFFKLGQIGQNMSKLFKIC